MFLKVEWVMISIISFWISWEVQLFFLRNHVARSSSFRRFNIPLNYFHFLSVTAEICGGSRPDVLWSSHSGEAQKMRLFRGIDTAALYTTDSQNIWNRSKTIGPIFTSCTVTKNTVGVQNNVLYIQKVCKLYVLPKACCELVFDTVTTSRNEIRKK